MHLKFPRSFLLIDLCCQTGVCKFEEIPTLLFIGTTRELWPRSKKSLEMTSKLGIPVSVTLNMDIRHAVKELGSLGQLPHVSYECFQKILGLSSEETTPNQFVYADTLNTCLDELDHGFYFHFSLF